MTTYIGETYNWEPTAFMENGWRDGNKNHKKGCRPRARRLHQRGAPLLYGGGGYQREDQSLSPEGEKTLEAMKDGN